jgi:hypothetical protein
MPQVPKTLPVRLSQVKNIFGGVSPPNNLNRYFKDDPAISEPLTPLVNDLPANRLIQQYPINTARPLSLKSFRGSVDAFTATSDIYDWSLENEDRIITAPDGAGQAEIKVWGGGGGGSGVGTIPFPPFNVPGGSGGGGGFLLTTSTFNVWDTTSFRISVGRAGQGGPPSSSGGSVNDSTVTATIFFGTLTIDLILAAGGGGGGLTSNIQGGGGTFTGTVALLGEFGADGSPGGFGGNAAGISYTGGGGTGGDWFGMTYPSAPGAGGAGAQDGSDPFGGSNFGEGMAGAGGRIQFDWS